MICSICIPTFKRPSLLKKLLISLYNQELDENTKLEIIVVDNDREESAKNICAGFSNTDKIVLYYLTQPEKNISLTRNKAVKKASGDYILFADDDVVTVPKWVRSHIETMNNYNADIVIGRAIADFEGKVPEYIRKQKVFNLPAPPTGTPTLRFYTGNSSLRAKWLKPLEEPFDPSLGIIGGEDGKLFQTLRQNGAKVVFSYEAMVAEHIPSESSRVNWIIKRAFRQGYMFTHDYIQRKNPKYKIGYRIYLTAKSLIFGFISAILFILSFYNKTFMVHWLTKNYSNAGHLLAAIGYRHKDLKRK